MVLELITPTARTEIHDVCSVVFLTSDGQMGILPGHRPVICQVDAGVLVATLANGIERFVTGSGLAQVDGSRVRLLVHELVAERDIVTDAAWAALEAAEKSLSSPDCTNQADLREQYLEQIHYAQAQLELKSSR